MVSTSSRSSAPHARSASSASTPGCLKRSKRDAAASACEHSFVMFSDALLLLFEMADREDERFQAAAARWQDAYGIDTAFVPNSGLVRLARLVATPTPA